MSTNTLQVEGPLCTLSRVPAAGKKRDEQGTVLRPENANAAYLVPIRYQGEGVGVGKEAFCALFDEASQQPWI